tara:strand:- start:8 stop:271 length:264 start_codon:yes stop_codon:yes gene_type:complete
MNKILIALVLAVGLSGNAYPNFITDLFKSEEEKERSKCLEAVEKGKLFEVHEFSEYPVNHYKSYVYKGETYTFNFYKNECKKVPYYP